MAFTGSGNVSVRIMEKGRPTCHTSPDVSGPMGPRPEWLTRLPASDERTMPFLPLRRSRVSSSLVPRFSDAEYTGGAPGTLTVRRSAPCTTAAHATCSASAAGSRSALDAFFRFRLALTMAPSAVVMSWSPRRPASVRDGRMRGGSTTCRVAIKFMGCAASGLNPSARSSCGGTRFRTDRSSPGMRRCDSLTPASLSSCSPSGVKKRSMKILAPLRVLYTGCGAPHGGRPDAASSNVHGQWCLERHASSMARSGGTVVFVSPLMRANVGGSSSARAKRRRQHAQQNPRASCSNSATWPS